MILRRLPLRHSLPAVLLFGAFIIGISSYAYNAYLVGKEVLHEAHREALELHRLRDDLEYALQQNYMAHVRHVVAELGSDPDIISSYFVDDNDVVLASTDLAAIDEHYQPEDILVKKTTKFAPIVVTEDNTLFAKYPILLALSDDELRSSRMGHLYVHTDLTRRLFESRRHIELQALSFGGFFVTIALALWFYFYIVVGRRMNRLQSAVYAFGAGELGVRSDLKQGDELGDLAQSFNRMAEQLEEQQGHLTALQEALDEHAIVSITDVAGRITFVNDRFCQISGYSRQELLGQNHHIVNSGVHDVNFFNKLWQTISSGNIWQGVIKNSRKDGKPYWVQSTIVPILDEKNHPLKYISIRTDVTQRERLRQAMEQLATATAGEKSYDDIAKAVCIGLDCRWAGFGQLTNNAQEIQVLGFWQDGAVGEKYSYALTNTPCADVCANKQPILVTDQVIERYPNHHALAEFGAVSYRGEPLLNENGSVFGVLFAFDDQPCGEDEADRALLKLAAKRVTLEYNRSGYEQALRENELQLAQAQHMAQLGSWTLDHASNDLFWSDEVYRIFNIDKSCFEASYEAFLDAIHPQDREIVNQAYQASLNAKTPYSIVHRLLMKDNSVKWVHERGETYYDDDGKPLRSIGYVHDITESREAEQEQERLQVQLQQAQKMEAIGQLTGGIAHDFNNILTAIIGFSTLSLDYFANDSHGKPHEYLTQVLHAGERGRDLVAQMLAFGRARPGEHKPVDAAAMIKEVVSLLSSTLPSSISIDIDLADEVPLVMADPVQLHQVITNLAINARDAVGEHGHINLSLSELINHEGVCSSCYQPFSGDFIEISVRDNGHGIPDEQFGRVFEPFFSTKEVGKGSGMGLAMVHGILHQCEGHILLESDPHKGTIFHLLLSPAPAAMLALQKEEDSLSPAGVVADRRIMVVDDEPSVSEFLSELFRGCGYQVCSFNDPLLALKSFESDPNAIDLVITDQTMPKLTGAELAQKLLTLRPNLLVVLCTGYSESIDEQGARRLGISEYFQKPVDPSQFLHSISTLLNTKN